MSDFKINKICSKGSQPKLLHRQEERLSNWVTLVTRTVLMPSKLGDEVYHGLRCHDYVCLLGLTPDGCVPLVRQYRVSVEQLSIELPSGLLDSRLKPQDAAVRELEEETGWTCQGDVKLMGTLNPDSARAENRLWCFFCERLERLERWQPEEGIETFTVSCEKLLQMTSEGDFQHALHVAAVGLALVQGRIGVPK